MLTAVWGPSLWHYLHTMSFNYPVSPTSVQKRQYMDFIMSLRHVLPCRACRENLCKNFKRCPLTVKDMASRETFSRYVYRLHETVNKMLGKKSGLTYCAVRQRYEHFRARCGAKQGVTLRTRRHESGCTEPIAGRRSKCVIHIVPREKRCKTMRIDRKCMGGRRR